MLNTHGGCFQPPRKESGPLRQFPLPNAEHLHLPRVHSPPSFLRKRWWLTQIHWTWLSCIHPLLTIRTAALIKAWWKTAWKIWKWNASEKSGGFCWHLRIRSDGYFSCPLEIYLFEIAEALVLSNWGNQRPSKRIIKGKTKGSFIQQVERGILEISITQKGTHRVTPPETYIYIYI